MALYSQFQGQNVFTKHDNEIFSPIVFCQGPKIAPTGELYYTVVFSDGWLKDVLPHELIGADLSPSSTNGTIHLCLGQRISVSHLGKEHRGSVISQVGENVSVRLDAIDELEMFNIRQLRLSSDISRHHFGCLENSIPDTANSKVAMLQQTQLAAAERQIRTLSPKGNLEAANQKADHDDDEEDHVNTDWTTEDDIKAAAIALTSLSLSPSVKPHNDLFVFPVSKSGPEEELKISNEQLFSIKVDDEGYYDKLVKPRTRSFESPRVTNSRKRRTVSLDYSTIAIRGQKLERAESWDTETTTLSETKPSKSENSSKAFQCMWRGCGKVMTSLPRIIRHVKKEHLGPKDDDSVEFYFNDLFLHDTSNQSDDSSLSSGIDEDEADGDDAAQGSLESEAANGILKNNKESVQIRTNQNSIGQSAFYEGQIGAERGGFIKEMQKGLRDGK
eukprot:gene12199-13455_t